ncbi:MAG: outer rane chaperone Skp (OmpH) [Firmicutes bacterium]|nr:outer rane chaperone Skp (OmpH) [Bacillota bacterium]
MIWGKKRSLAFVIATVFMFLGVVGFIVSQNSTTFAATPSSNIGLVDFQQLMSQHPDTAAANTTMQAAIDQAKKDFDAKTASMNDQDKQNYYNQLQQQLAAKQQEIFAPIVDKISAAIKQVADSKGLAVVIYKGAAVYGGQDITSEVAKKF